MEAGLAFLPCVAAALASVSCRISAAAVLQFSTVLQLLLLKCLDLGAVVKMVGIFGEPSF